ncbi:MAG: prepilin-type N-terminal cleavage/methylation domain-containing protein [Deltaproteobacteria bacterium]|nr:prepilin-type N-terminal cleavage/methylation domain-containing protein [Deltaproteobacteria bacterium]
MVKTRTRILTAGKQTNDGFTLIELTVVVFLVSFMLLLAVPRVRDTVLTDGLKSTVNHLANTARELRSDAARNQVDYILHLDLNNNLIWTYSIDMSPEAKSEMKERSFHIPEDVKIEDIYRFGGNKVIDGEATIRFYKRGYAQPTVLHLARKDDRFTVIFEPFVSLIKTYDRYIDYRPPD